MDPPPPPPSHSVVRKIGVTLFKQHTRPVKPPLKSPSFSQIRNFFVSNTHPVSSKPPLDPPSREDVNPHLKKSDVQSGQAEKGEEIVMADVVAASPVIEKFKKEVERLKVMKSQVQEKIGIAKDKGDNLLSGVEEWLNKAVDEISKAEVLLEQESNAKKRCFEEFDHYGKMATKMTPPLLEHQVCGKEFVTCVSVNTPAPGPSDIYESKHLDDIVTIPVVDQKVPDSLSVENLRHEAEKLKVMRERVQELINISIRKGDRLSHGVEDWVKEADAVISKVDEVLEEEANAKKTWCKIALCGTCGTLHRYSKSAKKMALSLLQLQERGSTYESCVSVEQPAPGPLDFYRTKNLDDLDTQSSALGDIIKSLEDDNIQIIGIYGLGGVGKTTLAKEVVARVKNKLFADVAFTTVSQNVDVEKIKKDIGEAIKRIMKGEKILIILDDVWEELNLEELCIPFRRNYMNCKILLTSRSEKVCQKMNAQSKICVNSLPTEEAWILFKRVVGERLEIDSNFKPLALKVVEECGGLPLLIQAVGNALKYESIESWEWALTQLQKHAPLDIDDNIRKSFTHLKLSYDYLKSEEAKSCFLLCSLFPEDSNISLEDLVLYGVGLGKFDNLDSIEDARCRVQNAVNILTSSGLLLNREWEGSTKMHDVVRDVALLIASQGKNKFLVKARQGLTEWLPSNKSLERYTGISLMKNWISKLPDYEFDLSRFDIFLVNKNPLLRKIPDEFIKGMKEVKVLDMGWCLISRLPQSLKLLTKLRMLNLEENHFFHEISILGEMKSLEILILNRTGIKEIPKEIGQLANLRQLEVSRCRYMTRVTPGVISALWRLEELCIDLWQMSEGVNGCIAEVMKLSKLTYLDLKVKSFDHIPEGFNSENLKGFVIQIGEYHRDFYRGNELNRSDRYLIISRVHLVIPLLNWLKILIEVSRPLTILDRIVNENNIMPDLYHEGFNKLEHIQLNYCPKVSCLLDDGTRCDGDEGKTEKKFFMELKHFKLWYLDNLEVLWKYEYVSLNNLVTLYIGGCDKLKRVFKVSVAEGFVNLKKLDIEGCDGLEEVIWGGGGGDGDDESGNVIVFPSLANISLCLLSRLKVFFNSAGNCSISYPSLVEVKLRGCGNMEIWGPGIHETPNLKTLEMDYDWCISLDASNAINEAIKKSWRK